VSGRILIIENDADVRDALADGLSDTGLCVEVASDGLDGLARLRAGEPPVVILLDLRMPRLGGEAFLHALREDPVHGDVPVITMTAGADAPSDGGVLAHLRKPFDLEDLRGLVLSLVELRSAK
jgi:two-component system, chemotaxis family, chemotaxis protein CheY